MVEEKNNPPEENTDDFPDQSSFDEFLAEEDAEELEAGTNAFDSEVSEEGDELDQDSIDALFAGGAEEEEPPAAGSEEEIEDEGELDQDSVDALFSGSSEDEEEEPAAGGAVEDRDSGQEPEPEDEAAVGDLDQDSIDALFAGGTEEEQAFAAAAGEGMEEEGEATVDDLDQNSIDALFAESRSAEEEGLDVPEAPGDEGEIDQSAIDALFTEDDEVESPGGETEETSGEEKDEEFSPGEEDLDQSNIDALFEGGAEEESLEDEVAAAGKDVFEESAAAGGEEALAEEEFSGEESDEDLDELFASLEEDEEEKAFLGEDFTFAEEIEDDSGEEGEVVELSDDEEEVEGKAAAAAMAAGRGEEKKSGKIKTKGKMSFAALPALVKSKKTLAGLGGSLVLVLAVSLYFLLGGDGSRDDKEKGTAVSEPVNVAKKEEEKSPREKKENFIPVASSVDYTMPPEGGNVKISLEAVDRDADKLDFVITKRPGFGRLSGTAPDLTYLPSADFSGEDSFRFKVGDGKSFSEEAEVHITGPDLTRLAEGSQKEEAAKPEEGEKKEEAPRIKTLARTSPPVKVSNITVTTTSTDSVLLDLAALWEKINKSDYDRTVYCSLDVSGLRGTIQKTGEAVYRYKADPFFSGIEIVDYRFKKNGISSSTGRITIQVTLGNPPPVLEVRKMERMEYAVGETVVIDASPSRDDKRQSLQFDWEQIAGVPVQIRKENQEGSRISFVMPSDFSSRRNPGPLLKVTATDASGQKDVELIKTRSVSLRGSALWRGDEVRANEGH